MMRKKKVGEGETIARVLRKWCRIDSTHLPTIAGAPKVTTQDQEMVLVDTLELHEL